MGEGKTHPLKAITAFGSGGGAVASTLRSCDPRSAMRMLMRMNAQIPAQALDLIPQRAFDGIDSWVQVAVCRFGNMRKIHDAAPRARTHQGRIQPKRV